MAIGILLGVYDIQTIATTAIGTALALESMHFFVYQEETDILQLFVATFIVLAAVTYYIISLRTEAKLLARLESLAHERDEIITGLPEHTYVLVLS